MATSYDPKPGVGTQAAPKTARVRFITNAVYNNTVFYKGWEANLPEDDVKHLLKDKSVELVKAEGVKTK